MFLLVLLLSGVIAGVIDESFNQVRLYWIALFGGNQVCMYLAMEIEDIYYLFISIVMR